MAQHTAVELLFEKLWNTPKDKLNWYAIRKEAMELEKEQQFRFFIAGQISMEEGGKDFIQYYNKTYSK